MTEVQGHGVGGGVYLWPVLVIVALISSFALTAAKSRLRRITGPRGRQNKWQVLRMLKINLLLS